MEYQYDKYPSTAQDNLWMKVSAELAWQILAGDIDPQHILTPQTYDVQPAGDNRNYYFSLTQNPAFAERVISLYVTSPEPDFEPLTVTITQDYTRPQITVTNPAGTSKEVHFGIVEDANPQPVAVDIQVNSDWKFTTSGDYAKVVATTDIPAGVEQPGGMPNEPVDKQVKFTPFVYQPEVGTPVQGTTVTGTITFTTANHLDAPASTQNVSVKTTVPAFFDHTSVKIKREADDADAIPAGEELRRPVHNVYIEVASNTAWSGRTSENTTRSHTQRAWGIHQEAISVPANQTFEKRDITFYYTYDGVENEIATYTQDSYFFDRIEMEYEESELKGWSRDYTFRAYGSFPSGKIRIKHDLTTATSSFPSAESSSSTTTITVSRNRTGDVRNVTFSYSIDDGATWQELLTMPQRKGNRRLSTGVYVAVQDLNEGDYIPDAQYNHYTRTTMDWSTAMGIDEKFNTEGFNGADAEGNYVATRQTGCAAYGEPNDPSGTWRLPTSQELEEIHTYRSDIDKYDGVGLPILSSYWSQNEVEGNATRAHGIYYPVNQVYTPTQTAKTSKVNVRCVSIDNTHEDEIR